MRLHLASALAHKHVLLIQLWMLLIHETAAAQQSLVRLISIQKVSPEILFNAFVLTNSFISITI